MTEGERRPVPSPSQDLGSSASPPCPEKGPVEEAGRGLGV